MMHGNRLAIENNNSRESNIPDDALNSLEELLEELEGLVASANWDSLGNFDHRLEALSNRLATAQSQQSTNSDPSIVDKLSRFSQRINTLLPILEQRKSQISPLINSFAENRKRFAS